METQTYPVYHVRGAMCDGSCGGAFPALSEEARVTMARVMFADDANMPDTGKIWFFVRNCTQDQEEGFLGLLESSGVIRADCADAESALDEMVQASIERVGAENIVHRDIREKIIEVAEAAANRAALAAAMTIVGDEYIRSYPDNVQEALRAERAAELATRESGLHAWNEMLRGWGYKSAEDARERA